MFYRIIKLHPSLYDEKIVRKLNLKGKQVKIETSKALKSKKITRLLFLVIGDITKDRGILDLMHLQ